jgi:[CysO sulfur-carrier protein]-S-L-cysteine hydrolase
VLHLAASVYAAIIGSAYDGLPYEACGLLGGDPGSGRVRVFYPCTNIARSSRIYTLDPKEGRSLEVIGVVHSHTHTDAYPSPTDVAQAPDPAWRYVIVSLRDDAPVLRSYRLVDGTIAEEPVGLLAER